MAVNNDFATPLLVNSPDQYNLSDEEKPVKHSWAAWLGFVLAIFALLGTFFYSLSYSFMNTYTNPVPAPFVTTRTGNVSGYWDPATPNLAVFRGIPYAVQPVGQRRWKLPTYPAESWTGTKQTVTDGKMCYQFGARPVTQFPNQGEDCLTLNVWTNNLNNATGLWDNSTKPLPTLVWIYGGSNVYGSIDMYRGLDNWARNGPICLVSMNYRLNAFGYLALKALSQNDTRQVSGNYGIADIQAALKWVQDNIASFGCDPKRVTLFGQSSGGTNILALLASPKSKGLFHRAISLSGSANISMNLDSAETHNEDTFLTNINCNSQTDVLACLYSKTPDQILQAIPNDPKTGWAFTDFWPTSPDGLVRPGLVIVDGDIVTMSLTAALAQALIDVDLIIENVRDELELFWQAPDVVAKNGSDYNDYILQNFANWTYQGPAGETTGSEVVRQYQSVTDVSVTRSYYDLNSDIGIYCANVELGKIAGQSFKSQVYVSTVWQPPSHNLSTDPNVPPTPDAVHLWDFVAATEAWNFFQTDGGSIFAPNVSQDAVPAYNPSTTDMGLSSLLQTQFYDFIINGKVTDGMKPVTAVDNFPTQVNIAVQGDATWSGKVANTVNFRSDYCDNLKTIGLAPSDGRFWWIN